MDTTKNIYEGWAEDLTLAAPCWYSHEEANGWNNGFTSGYTAALEDRLEDVALSYAEWNEKYGFMWDNDGYSSNDKFNHFINNIYNGK